MSHLSSFRHPSTLNPLKSRRFVVCMLVGTLAASLVPHPTHAETADPHAPTHAPLEAALGSVAQDLCPPLVSGGAGNPAIGTLWASHCINLPIPKLPIGCEVCSCWYGIEYINGDVEFVAATALGCGLF